MRKNVEKQEAIHVWLVIKFSVEWQKHGQKTIELIFVLVSGALMNASIGFFPGFHQDWLTDFSGIKEETTGFIYI